MNDVPITSVSPKDDYEKFLQDAKNSAECSNSFEPAHFNFIGEDSEATWNFEKHVGNLQGTWGRNTQISATP